MKTLDQLFSVYEYSHRHPINKLIHYICVPAIVLSVMGLLWPLVLFRWGEFPIRTTYLAIAGVSCYLLWLRVDRLTIISIILMIVAAWSLGQVIETTGIDIFQVSLAVFIVGWIGQFIGHKIEGRKPSLFQDLQFLIIGPLWLLKGFIERKSAKGNSA